jgi:hypothetical protein
MSSDVDSVVQENNIHIGFWINWSQGRIAGATYTVTHRDGGFLIAFLAFFITFVGTCFWRIISFIAHQYFSREDAQDAIYHQRQVIFRNSNSSGAGLWKLLRMLWAWRRHGRASPFKRIFPSLLLGLFTLSTFLVAGIFSSRVATSTSGEVLVSSLNCGVFEGAGNDSADWISAAYSYLHAWIGSSYNYVQSCYGSNSSTKDCTVYSRQSLPFSITRSTACPFPGQDSICRNVSGNIRIDTGFINSHFDLGINAPPENRFLLRRAAECAPLLNDGYTQVQNSTATTPLIDVLYGPGPQYGNATYQYSNAAPLSVEDIGYGIFDYVLGQQSYSPTASGVVENSTDQWNPIPELLITDGDVTVLFLSSNDVSFINKTADPWYSAQTLQGDPPGSSWIPVYVHDDAVRALGCIERLQFCNPNLPANSSCTPLTGSSQAFQLGPQLWQDLTQQAYFNWSTSSIGSMAPGIDAIVSTIGAAVLQSRNTLISGSQSFIPDNQWELEAENLFKVALASLQRIVVDQATGPADPALLQILTRPNTTEQQKACANQKIRSDSYTSINVLGLGIIFVVGGLIIVTSFALPIIVRRIQQRQNSYSSLEWMVNDTLQLQRLAHEAIGAGIWQDTDGDFPTTAQCELLAELDVTNPTHPKLHCTHHDNTVNDDVRKTVVDEGCLEPLIFPTKVEERYAMAWQ